MRFGSFGAVSVGCAAIVAAATMLSASAAFAAGPAAATPAGPAISEEARRRFASGVSLLKDPEGPRYEEAYREFKAAYAASPSYKILGNLGLCAMKLERDDEAIDAYEKYLAEGKELSPAEQQQIRSDLATLKTGVAHVMIESDPPGARIFDDRVPNRGERVLTTYGPIDQPTRLGLHQGTHEMTAKLDGYPDQTWNVEAPGGQDLPAHKFAFPKAVVAPPPPVAAAAPAPAPAPAPVVVTSRPVTAGVWAGVTATGVFTVATVITGALALSKHSDYQTANNGTDPSKAQSIRSTGETLNVVSDVCLGGAVVAAAITTILFVGRPSVESPADAQAASTRVRVVPSVGSSGGGLALLGRF
jgi:hypothetical protein